MQRHSKAQHAFVDKHGLAARSVPSILMAKYDVYPGSERDMLLLDVQADLLDALNTRMVVPLMAVRKAPDSGKAAEPCICDRRHPSMSW